VPNAISVTSTFIDVSSGSHSSVAGILHCVTGQVIHDVVKNKSAFSFEAGW